MLAAAKSLGLVLLAAYVFYDSFAAALFLIPAGVFYMTDCVADLEEKKEREFLGQFRDGIQAVAAGLKAGYSVENAIRGAGRDIEPLYSEEKRIRREFGHMVRQLDMNMNAGTVLEQFAERTKQEDVENFVHVFAAAKKSGGDSIAIIRNSVRLISERIDTEKEIRTMIASQKLEFDIMCAVPFAIILYCSVCHYPVYENDIRRVPRHFVRKHGRDLRDDNLPVSLCGGIPPGKEDHPDRGIVRYRQERRG